MAKKIKPKKSKPKSRSLKPAVKKAAVSSGRVIYMDYAASTPVRKEVIDAMLPYMGEKFGNPSSPHGYGQEAREAIEESKERIAKTINASPEEIVFTSGSTESSVLGIKGIAYAKAGTGKHILSSVIEHDSVFSTCKSLVADGYMLSNLLVDIDGLISIADLRSKITPKTTLISIQHSNGEVGTIQPIEDVGRIAKEKNVTLHTDATFSYGWVPLDVKRMNVDLMTFDAHHSYGPKGIGALFIKEGTQIKPLLNSRGNQFRPGTLDIASMVGFATAAELAHKEMKSNYKNLVKMQKTFIDYVEENIKFVKLNGHISRRLPQNINFSFSGITGQELIKQLESNKVIASTSIDGRVLEAIGAKGEKFTGSVRFSFGKDTSPADVKTVLHLVQTLVERERKSY